MKSNQVSRLAAWATPRAEVRRFNQLLSFRTRGSLGTRLNDLLSVVGLFAFVLVASLTYYTETLGADQLTKPIVAPDLVFEERGGIVAIEAEYFFEQTLSDVRAWYLTTNDKTPAIEPDGDSTHIGGAAGGAYVELLPDTRRSHDDKLVKEENFENAPGKMAILSYKVHFNTPGTYWLWARAFSTTSEDNGLHFGIDGTWPATAQRWQTVTRGKWNWESKQRTEEVHAGVAGILTLQVNAPGQHTIHVSMREDGIALDRILLVNRKDYSPEGIGPESTVKTGKLPSPFAFVEAPKPTAVAELPLPKGTVALRAPDFSPEGTGYYLDKGKWLAINPEQRKEASVQAAFPFPSGRYNVTLQAVGESDGCSTYRMTCNASLVGEHTCPLAKTTYEEGEEYYKTWDNVELNSGDVLEVSSKIASSDGKEFSRARWAAIVFQPADDTTTKALAAMKPSSIGKPYAQSARDKGPPLVQPRQPNGDGSVSVSGELKQWHKVTLTLNGPFANEQDNEPNPFTDIDFTVTFIHESGSPKYVVPGYFAADGNAANSSAKSGTHWRAHLSPDKTGIWNYQIALKEGPQAAIGAQGKGNAMYDGKSGSFVVTATDKLAQDFRSKGRLQYVGGHYLRHAGTGEYFLKIGPDSPETLLAYKDFDDTVAPKAKSPIKTWQPHVQDWKNGDPTWKNGKGKGLIGAMNYLSLKGCNSISFLPYNAGGDGDNIWPFVEREDKLHYDCSKLDQWAITFDHATNLGLYLHFKLQENELDDNRRGDKLVTGNIPESLDGGELGIERKLYCREMIARFSHELAINWNIGEENTQSSEEQIDKIRYLQEIDPYKHHVVLHTFPNAQDKVYVPLLGDKSLLTGVSLQNSWSAAHQQTLKWLNESAKAGRPWVVCNDEQNPASDGVPADPGYEGKDGYAVQQGKKYNLHDVRKLCLWGTLMAGGGGVEYYFGYKHPQNDLVCEDFRSRDQSWDYCRVAVNFFRDQKIPFWEMTNADALVGNAEITNSKYCFAKKGEIYLIYLPKGGTTQLDLTEAKRSFAVSWFNPRVGGELLEGSVKSVEGGREVSVGNPPSDLEEDWLVIVR